MDAHFCPTVQILSINISIFMLLDISLYKHVVTTLLFLGRYQHFQNVGVLTVLEETN